MAMKQCTGLCGDWLPTTAQYFHRNGYNKDGSVRLRAMCGPDYNIVHRRKRMAAAAQRRYEAAEALAEITSREADRARLLSMGGLPDEIGRAGD